MKDSNGNLCLEFVDTVDWRVGKKPEDHLKNYANLLQWSKEQGLLTETELGRLKAEAEKDPVSGARVLDEAITLREVLYRLFSASAHGTNPAVADVEALNLYLSKSFSMSRVSFGGKGFDWGWRKVGQAPDSMLWPVAMSAAELLTSPELDNVKECANEADGCGWLFFDTTRNHSRKWCSMDSCGNRMKFRTYYDRHTA